MGRFVIGTKVTYFATFMGLVLFGFNIVGLLPDEGLWWKYLLLSLGGVAYLAMMFIAIRCPVSDLKPLNKEEEQTEDKLEQQKVQVEWGGNHHKHYDDKSSFVSFLTN